MDQKQFDRFIETLGGRLLKVGIKLDSPDKDGNVPMCRITGEHEGHITHHGGMVLYPEHLPVTKTRAEPIFHEVEEYMRLWEEAEPLTASGLSTSAGYRALTQFGNVVLGAQRTKYGMMFVTWEWVQNHSSLWSGHYHEDYTAAKTDFAIRSGLVDSRRVFTVPQIKAMAECITEALDQGHTACKDLEGARRQMEQFLDALQPDGEEGLPV